MNEVSGYFIEVEAGHRRARLLNEAERISNLRRVRTLRNTASGRAAPAAGSRTRFTRALRASALGLGALLVTVGKGLVSFGRNLA